MLLINNSFQNHLWKLQNLTLCCIAFSGRRKIWKGGIHIDPSLEVLSEIIL